MYLCRSIGTIVPCLIVEKLRFNMLERTLVLLKPCTMERGLIGEIINRYEKKGLRIAGMKMMQLDDAILAEHYAHLADKPFFGILRDSMKRTPVVAMCLEGLDAISVVRKMTGSTNGRNADLGTIRGDYCMSNQQNIVHASDSPESAQAELNRFFRPEEIFDLGDLNMPRLYALDEI